MDMTERHVKIYGRDIKVAFFDRLAGDALGRAHYGAGIIEILEGEPHHEFRTLIREMAHHAMNENGMVNLIDYKVHEAVCDYIQHFITQIYEPNREMLMEIQSGREASRYTEGE